MTIELTGIAGDPNRAETPNVPELPELAPGVVEPGTCWVLRNEHKGWRESEHFPTWEEANRAVRIDPDADPEYDWRSYDVLEKRECGSEECLRQRRLAEIAYRDHQHHLQVEQATADQERHEAAAAYREDRIRLHRREADCAEQLLELQREEAIRSEERLQLQRDEADRQLQLDLDQAVAGRDADVERAATVRAWRLVEHATHQIGLADAKAGLVVTLQLGLIAAAGSGVLGDSRGLAGVLRWVAIAVLLIGVLIAAWAVLPRLPRRTGEGQGTGLNFGVARGLDGIELASLLCDLDEFAAASAEAADLARITHAKYARIRWSMAAGVLGLVLAVIATALGTALGTAIGSGVGA